MKQETKRVPQQCLLCGTIFWCEPHWEQIVFPYTKWLCFARKKPFKRMANIRQFCGRARRINRYDPGWVYLTTGGVLANHVKIGVSHNWPGSRASGMTEQWPADLWGSRVKAPYTVEWLIKDRLIKFRAKQAVYPTETFEIDLDLALSIVADIVGRPLERLAYAEQRCPVSIPTR